MRSESEDEQDDPAEDDETVEGEESSGLEDVRDRLREARKSDGRIPSAPPSNKMLRPVELKTINQFAEFNKNLGSLTALQTSPAFKLAIEPSPLAGMSEQLSKVLGVTAGVTSPAFSPALLDQLDVVKRNREMVSSFYSISGLKGYHETMERLSKLIQGYSVLPAIQSVLRQYSAIAEAIQTPALAGLPPGFLDSSAFPRTPTLSDSTLQALRKLYEPFKFADLLDFEVVPGDDGQPWIPGEFWEIGLEYFERAADYSLRTADSLAGPEEAMRVSMALLYLKELSWKQRVQEAIAAGFVALYGVDAAMAMDAFYKDPNAVTFVLLMTAVFGPLVLPPGEREREVERPETSDES